MGERTIKTYKRKTRAKNTTTSDAKIRSALRMVFLRSRERAEVLKRDNYSCSCCHRRKTKTGPRMEVHHINGVNNWGKIIKEIRKELLCSPKFMQVLCRECHARARPVKKKPSVVSKRKKK